ncbi:MAG: pentapeptide repeat-containing protein, partial [Cyanobacteria bacterium J06642_11]
MSRVKLRGVDFVKTYLHRINLQGANLAESTFSKVLGTVNSVAFSPDGRRLAIGESNGSVQVWDIATSQVVLLCTGHSREVLSVAFSPDGKRLASAGDDKTVKLWDSETGNCIYTLTGHKDWFLSVAFSPDGQTLA